MLGWLVGLLWSSANPLSVVGAGTNESRPLILIDVLCSKLLGENRYVASCSDPCFSLSVCANTVDAAGLEGSCAGLLRQDILRLSLAREMTMGGILSRLCFEVTCGKHRPAAKERLRSLLAAIIREIGELMDILTEAHLSSDFTSMSVEAGRSGTRGLRTAQSYKTGMSAMA
eukprot:2111465-Amphidinium_carterae.1